MFLELKTDDAQYKYCMSRVMWIIGVSLSVERTLQRVQPLLAIPVELGKLVVEPTAWKDCILKTNVFLCCNFPFQVIILQYPPVRSIPIQCYPNLVSSLMAIWPTYKMQRDSRKLWFSYLECRVQYTLSYIYSFSPFRLFAFTLLNAFPESRVLHCFFAVFI